MPLKEVSPTKGAMSCRASSLVKVCSSLFNESVSRPLKYAIERPEDPVNLPCLPDSENNSERVSQRE